MFAEILTLKGPAPQVVYGVIKSRRSTKVVAHAWRLKSRPAARKFEPALLTPPRFVKADEPTMEETMLASQEEKSRRRYNRILLLKAALAEQRTAEDDIEPRLRAKLAPRWDEGLPRSWESRKELRSHSSRCWKDLRKTKWRRPC